MELASPNVISALWLAWLIYWAVAARHVKQTAWRESAAAQARHRVPIWVAALLLGLPRLVPAILRRRVFALTPTTYIAGIVLVAAGLALSVWARWHLGRNWSGRVTVKADHSLIRTGPYAHVRHPIYTGLLAACLGTAIGINEWRGLIAFLLALVALVQKLRVEEDRMKATFPEYDGYRRETAALVPFVY